MTTQLTGQDFWPEGSSTVEEIFDGASREAGLDPTDLKHLDGYTCSNNSAEWEFFAKSDYDGYILMLNCETSGWRSYGTNLDPELPEEVALDLWEEGLLKIDELN